MKKLLILAGATLALLLTPQIASAAPGDPIISGSLEVAVEGTGRITGTSINCPGDCSDDESWGETELPPKNRLTAVETVAGWAFQNWNGCTPLPSDRKKCDAGYAVEAGGDPVSARFIDVMAPNLYISFISPADEINESFLVGAVANDNDRVTKVDFLVGDTVVATRTEAPYNAEIDASGLAEGTHQLRARAYDPAGNNGITVNWPITVDHTAPDLTITSPVTATNAARPEFSFDSASPDFDAAECAIQTPDEGRTLDWCGRNEPFAGDAPSEGEWEFVVHGRDRAGNVKVASHSFIVDRTAPELAFTGGPADGATVEKGNVEYTWSVADGLAVTQKCSFDGGEKADCDGKVTRSLVKGSHTFELEVTDLAGNVSTLSRTVNVKQDGDPIPDPDDPAGDKVAPVVKLISPKQKLKALKKGLKVKVRCSEACTGKVIAKGARGIRFTGTAKLASAGTKLVRLKPNAKTKKALRTSTKPLKLTVTSSLADPAGNRSSARLKTRVRK